MNLIYRKRLTSDRSAAECVRSHARGSASVEYIVVTVLICLVLFAPVPGGQSLFAWLLQSVRDYQAHTLFLLSMP